MRKHKKVIKAKKKTGYPYGLSLPIAFKGLIEECGIAISPRPGCIFVKIKNEAEMQKLIMGIAGKRGDGRAATIMAGLRTVKEN